MQNRLLIVVAFQEPHLSNAHQLRAALESRAFQTCLTDLEAMVETTRQWEPEFVVIDLPSLSDRYGALEQELARLHKDRVLRNVPVCIISPFVKGPFCHSSRCLGYPALAASVTPQGLCETLESERRWLWRIGLRLTFQFSDSSQLPFDELVVNEDFFQFSTKDPGSSSLTMSELKVVTEDDWMEIESVCEAIDIWATPSHYGERRADEAYFSFSVRIGSREAMGGGPVAGEDGLFTGRYSRLYQCLLRLIERAPVLKFPERRLDIEVVYSPPSLPHPLTLVLHNVSDKELVVEKILMLEKPFELWKETDSDQPVILQGPHPLAAGETMRLPLILKMPNGEDQVVTADHFQAMMEKRREMMFVLEPDDHRFALGAITIRQEAPPP